MTDTNTIADTSHEGEPADDPLQAVKRANLQWKRFLIIAGASGVFLQLRAIWHWRIVLVFGQFWDFLIWAATIIVIFWVIYSSLALSIKSWAALGIRTFFPAVIGVLSLMIWWSVPLHDPYFDLLWRRNYSRCQQVARLLQNTRTGAERNRDFPLPSAFRDLTADGTVDVWDTPKGKVIDFIIVKIGKYPGCWIHFVFDPSGKEYGEAADMDSASYGSELEKDWYFLGEDM
jgi:hypothetical protein